jgi:predicted NACHT family NTPase
VVAQAKIILTCRVNVWEANQATLQNFDVYRQLDFSYIAKYGRTIDQVEAFIDGWFAGNEEDKRKGKALRQALEQEGKQQIKDLAKNPLRLSLLCGVWEERWELPETRETCQKRRLNSITVC